VKTYHWNGERWYENDFSLWKRLRRWVVWFGGWETAKGGWQFRIPGYARKWLWLSPTPVSLFGHRFTAFGWGWQVRVPGGWLVHSREDGRRRLYVSRDGTPNRAHCWIIGAPHDVKRAAEVRSASKEAA